MNANEIDTQVNVEKIPIDWKKELQVLDEVIAESIRNN